MEKKTLIQEIAAWVLHDFLMEMENDVKPCPHKCKVILSNGSEWCRDCGETVNEMKTKRKE